MTVYYRHKEEQGVKPLGAPIHKKPDRMTRLLK